MDSKQSLIKIIPKVFFVSKYKPELINSHKITIFNKCTVPIVLNLKSTDTHTLILKEKTYRIGIKKSKQIPFTIFDKNYESNVNRLCGKNRKIFILITGDLIDEKYEVDLNYYESNEHNKSFSNFYINYGFHPSVVDNEYKKIKNNHKEKNNDNINEIKDKINNILPTDINESKENKILDISNTNNLNDDTNEIKTNNNIDNVIKENNKKENNLENKKYVSFNSFMNKDNNDDNDNNILPNKSEVINKELILKSNDNNILIKKERENKILQNTKLALSIERSSELKYISKEKNKTETIKELYTFIKELMNKISLLKNLLEQ